MPAQCSSGEGFVLRSAASPSVALRRSATLPACPAGNIALQLASASSADRRFERSAAIAAARRRPDTASVNEASRWPGGSMPDQRRPTGRAALACPRSRLSQSARLPSRCSSRSRERAVSAAIVSPSKQQQRSPRRFAVQRRRIVPSAQARPPLPESTGSSPRNLRAHGVDGAQVRSRRLIEQRPAKFAVARQHRLRKARACSVRSPSRSAGRAALWLLQVRQHAVAHLAPQPCS